MGVFLPPGPNWKVVAFIVLWYMIAYGLNAHGINCVAYLVIACIIIITDNASPWILGSAVIDCGIPISVFFYSCLFACLFVHRVVCSFCGFCSSFAFVLFVRFVFFVCISGATCTSRGWRHNSLHLNINKLVQERRNASALAMALRFSCTNPSVWETYFTAMNTCIQSLWYLNNCLFENMWGLMHISSWLAHYDRVYQVCSQSQTKSHAGTVKVVSLIAQST